MRAMEKKFNLRKDKNQLFIDASTIPTTISEKARLQWMDGDEDPYFKIQKIDYPIKANGDIYLESFFESFIASLADAPIPGSKDGHNTHWGARGTTDFVMVGAKMEPNGDGTGSVYFKNYIPKLNNEVFIKELESNMIEFSLVAYVNQERVDNGNGDYEWYVTKAVSGFRNDAVDVGAMEQKLNNKDNQGEKMATKKEHLDGLLGFKTNGEVTLLEVAKHLGLENQVITEDQKAKLNDLEGIVKLCGDKKPADLINEMLTEKKENAVKVRNAALGEAFGPEVYESTKKSNKARSYATKILGKDELTEEKINEIKADEIYLSLAAEHADVDSKENILGISESIKKENKVEEY